MPKYSIIQSVPPLVTILLLILKAIYQTMLQSDDFF